MIELTEEKKKELEALVMRNLCKIAVIPVLVYPKETEEDARVRRLISKEDEEGATLKLSNAVELNGHFFKCDCALPYIEDDIAYTEFSVNGDWFYTKMPMEDLLMTFALIM